MFIVVLEPSNFMFLDKNNVSDNEYLIKFADRLDKILEYFSDNGIHVGLTSNVIGEFYQRLPYKMKDSRNSDERFIHDLLNHRLMDRVREVSTDCLVEFVDENDVDLKSYSPSEVDILKNLLVLKISDVSDSVCSMVKKDCLESVFINESVNVKEGEKSFNYSLITDINKITDCNVYSIQNTIKKIKSSVTRSKRKVPVHGTGTHGSIFDESINSISDVPPKPRKLISELIKTNNVVEVKFLGFSSSKKPDYQMPYIKFESFEPKDSDCVHFGLYADGSKGQYQEFIVKFRKGFGKSFINSLQNVIFLEDIEKLISLAME